MKYNNQQKRFMEGATLRCGAPRVLCAFGDTSLSRALMPLLHNLTIQKKKKKIYYTPPTTLPAPQHGSKSVNQSISQIRKMIQNHVVSCPRQALLTNGFRMETDVHSQDTHERGSCSNSG